MKVNSIVTFIVIRISIKNKPVVGRCLFFVKVNNSFCILYLRGTIVAMEWNKIALYNDVSNSQPLNERNISVVIKTVAFSSSPFRECN